ncbi:zinc finger C2HC domain-containing protein 1A [Danio rerio]|uniref:Zinc finger C2HC domain-containing protein 1A n=1 Tax=Danio rerio TaxID=7955 RepID=ZC21A_DANRE|nr:zinc finger C2HC domain-containing protein 1A [Danio rerio]Q7SXT7.1 RecName: Full=Zinc finger C2HC domain-containing protein 1A [Danio rerio]AAH55250.1 Family with sequence similarity 164, member A [Danio rerio]|eukprot:NP_955974.1 zinc finger C2HC domain-containing protein 1A [Danio rerio]
MEEIEESPPTSEELVPCKICGRSFFPKVLKKHVPICQKTAAKRRKVFDSGRQRAEGTEISTVKPIKPKLQSSSSSSKSDKPEPPKKQSNWRRKHEEFIATIRAAKSINQVIKDGGPLPPPPPPSYDPDYIQCPYCQRRFGENAADRHIKFCKEQASRISNKSKLAGGDKTKPPARTQYKPPAPKKANSPTASSVSSRLPQRSAYGQGAGTGIPSSKPSSTGSIKSTPSGYSPLRNNSSSLTSPPSEGNMKPKGMVSQSSLRNPSTGIGMNKKKIQNADNCISRNDMKNENDFNYSTTGTKFCHECGTKYPVESAKFCCECGVKRMYI